MSKFDNRRITILGPHPMQGHCGVTGELQEPESERPWITVKLENREEVTISDPMQLFFTDGLGVPAPSSPSGSPLYLAEDGEDAASIPNAPSHQPSQP